MATVVTSWGKSTEPSSHTELEEKEEQEREGKKAEGRVVGWVVVDTRAPWVLSVAIVTCHNRQRRRRGYVTFRGAAGAEGERSSARRHHKGLNFHNKRGERLPRSGVESVGGWEGRG